MTVQETKHILDWICGTYPHLRVTDYTLPAWHALLADLDAADVKRAVHHLLATQTAAVWPAPGAIRRWVWDAHMAAEAPPPLEAWHQVLAAMRHYGAQDGPAALRRLPHLPRMVCEQFGWYDLCTGDRDVVRGQWLRWYAEARDRQWQATGALPPPAAAPAMPAGTR